MARASRTSRIWSTRRREHKSQYPNLQFSFTLATLGASDGSFGGVNSLGNEVVQAVLGSSLKNYVINLMTMDFGSASSSVCVVISGACEMAQSAIQAVKNLETPTESRQARSPSPR